MDKYILYAETVDGFSGQIFDKTFDSIAEFKDWLATGDFQQFAVDMKLHKIYLQNQITLECPLEYDIEWSA